MAPPVRLISSMATKQLLVDLIAQYTQHTPGAAQPVASEAVGGVDAAKRVRAGEAFDGVVLAANVVDALIAEGHVLAGSRVDLVRSGVSVAVREGAPLPDISTEEAVKRAVLAAPNIAYSTGPSGVYLAKLFERWGVAEELKARTVQAPPGVPVGSLVARGEVALGFQQYSELMSLPGITVVGPLPPEIQTITTFSAGVAATSAQPEVARAVLAFMASPATAETKRRNGMDAA